MPSSLPPFVGGPPGRLRPPAEAPFQQLCWRLAGHADQGAEGRAAAAADAAAGVR
jgi:hypothetical protein